MWYGLMIVLGVGLSVLTINPVPFVVVLLGIALIHRQSRKEEASVPPPPVDAVGMASCLLWVLAWVLGIVFVVAVAGVLLGGAT